MAVRSGGLAGAAGAQTKHHAKPFKFAQTGLCYDHIHKGNRLDQQPSAVVAQKAFVLCYVVVLVLLSVRCCYSNRNEHRETIFSLNTWSQYATYSTMLNNGHATPPSTTTGRKERENRPVRVILFLMTTLLMAGDIQLNPGPHLIGDGGLPPSVGSPGPVPGVGDYGVACRGGYHQVRGVGDGGGGILNDMTMATIPGVGASGVEQPWSVGVDASTTTPATAAAAATPSTAAAGVFGVGEGAGRLSPRSSGGGGGSTATPATTAAAAAAMPTTSAAEAEVFGVGEGVGRLSPRSSGGGGVSTATPATAAGPAAATEALGAGVGYFSPQRADGGGGEYQTTATSSERPKHKQKLKGINPAIKNYRKTKIFYTFNHAKIVWDPRSKPKGLLGGHLNIRSVHAKQTQLEHLLSHSNLDFLGLSETWLHPKSPESETNFPGYNLFRKDRVGGKVGGGVLIYVRDSIKCNVIEWSHKELNFDCIGLNIMLSPEMSFTVICLYRPPKTNSLFYDQLQTILKECDNKKEIIILGDVNLNWSNKSDRKRLKEITDKFNFTQLVKGPTRITESSETQIDLVFSNKPERIIKTYNMITGMSDHNITLLVRKLTCKRFNNTTKPKPTHQIIPKNEKDNLNRALQQTDWSNILCCQDVESGCHNFVKTTDKVVSPFLKSVKCGPRSNNTLPWINGALWQQMKERDYALKRSLKTGHRSDRQIFTSLRNKVTRNLRKAKADFFIKVIEEARGNGKLIWENLNKLTGRNKNKKIKDYELKVNGNVTQDHDVIAQTFNNFL